MGLRFIREPSDTPNVQIGDDVRAFRYAYGDQNGYIKGKGTECGYEVNGLNFIIKSGEIVINGYASEVDANGVTLTIDNIVTKRYYSVYYQVNLALFSVSILATYDTAGYPVINPGDDLNVNTVGTARMELYRFTATNGVIADVAKIVTSIRYGNDAAILTKGLIADARIPSNIARINGTYDNLTSGYSKYASTDQSKGTIEERLTNLGFRSGSISLAFGSTTVNSIKRQGNYVIGDISGTWTGTAAGASNAYLTKDTVVLIGTIPSNFRPKTTITIGVRHTVAVQSYSANAIYGQINTSGVLTVMFRVVGLTARTYKIDGFNFGYEANPI